MSGRGETWHGTSGGIKCMCTYDSDGFRYKWNSLKI